jgi:hypothetical protein
VSGTQQNAGAGRLSLRCWRQHGFPLSRRVKLGISCTDRNRRNEN